MVVTSRTEMRTCAFCGVTSPKFRYPRGSGGRVLKVCQKCRRTNDITTDGTSKYRHRNLRRYGITVADHEAMFVFQGQRCALCFTSEPGGRGFHVDHCHLSGQVRGLLCGRCNVGIGMFGEDAPRLLRAVTYLS